MKISFKPLVAILGIGLAVTILANGCGGSIVAPENTAQMAPREVVNAFTADLLQSGDELKAKRWVQKSAHLAVSSQALLISGEPRQVEYRLETAQEVPNSSLTSVRVSIARLSVGKELYSGTLEVKLDSNQANKITASELHLQRDDGLKIDI